MGSLASATDWKVRLVIRRVHLAVLLSLGLGLAACFGDARVQVVVENRSRDEVVLRLLSHDFGVREYSVAPLIVAIALDVPKTEDRAPMTAAVLDSLCGVTWSELVMDAGVRIVIEEDGTIAMKAGSSAGAPATVELEATSRC